MDQASAGTGACQGAAEPDRSAISSGTAGFGLFGALLPGLLTVQAYRNDNRVRQAILNEATAVGALYADTASTGTSTSTSE